MGMASAQDQAWYLVYTKPQQERVACENLDRQKFETYLPLLSRNVRRGRQFYQRVEPMFPRYLFIRLSAGSDDWGPIRSTIGVARLVKFGNHAARVPENLISWLRQFEGEDGVHELPDQEPQAGDPVRFIDGAMSGYEGIFHSRTSSERVIVLMEIAGNYSKLIVSSRDIELYKNPG